ncbi:putative Ribosomal protein S24e family protein [Melia azedarach]|uniref:Ribosomal protein S24e family protein n=1 Tax=Melia azedarach TaxID=155640 RepID=A0ACC1X090_MELAZ|nr:putative Ribosomal protein S24e family protein [Melia azedarach]
MSLLRNAIKSSVSLRAIKPSHGFPSLLRELPRRFSTETEAPPPPHVEDSFIDPFLQTPREGLAYGRLTGISTHTLKSDVINLLEGCNLTPDDVKVSYTRNYMPTAMMLQFPSHNAFSNAFRAIAKKNRLYRLEKVDRLEWDKIMPYDGKTILLQGIPKNALAEDVERLLSGCEFEASSIQMFLRPGYPAKMAIVHFLSRTQAMNAFIMKNRGLLSQ